MISFRNIMKCYVFASALLLSVSNLYAACPVPSGMTVSAVTASAATLNWSAVNGGSSYKVRYRKSGVSSWTSVTTNANSLALSGLAAASSYEWKVLTNCNPGNSQYSAISVFATLCLTPTVSGATNITNTTAQLNWSSTSCDSFQVKYYATSNPNTIFYKSVPQGTATSVIVSGLTAGINYTWLLRSYCMNGQSGSYSQTSSFTTLAPPCIAPGGLNASSITSSSANLGWTAAAGATGYNLQYRISGSSAWSAASTASTSFSLTWLTANTTYEFQVQTVCNGGGTSAWSGSSTFTTSLAPCSTPAGITAGNITSSGATLSWSVVSGAVSYNIQYRISGSSSWTSASSASASKSLTGLLSGTTYEYQVQTACSGNTSAWSASSTFTTSLAPCSTPSGLSAGNISASGATLSWSAVSGAVSYNIQYRINGGSSWTSTSSSTSSKVLSGLAGGTTYEFQVQTACSGNSSSWSGSSTFTTALPACSTPTGLTSGGITTSGATLSWSAVSGAISYSIQYRITGSSSWTSTTSSGTSKSLTGLSSGTVYEFQVMTICSGNNSAWSSSATFTTGTSCGTPVGLSTSSITSTSAIISWNAASGAVSYNVQYRKTGTSSWTTTSSTATSKTLTGLFPATSYEFQVLTVCTGGNSSWSAAGGFTTANSTTLPVPDHIVVLIEENHGYSQVIGSSSAPYINTLAGDAMSTLFTQMYGVEHPSQPNYLDLFSGSNQGVTNNNVPSAHFTTANLARELINAGKIFKSYSQNLPSVGYDGASSGKYMRKHNPVANWMGTGTNQVSSTLNQPFTAFPTDYNLLPTVSFVIPDQDYDMHDGTIATADTWFHSNLDGYVQWAKTHNSLFILIFDEDDGNYNNRIAMIFTGQMVRSGSVSTTYNHYNVLRTIEDMYGTTHAGNAASASAIHGCWTNGYKQSAMPDETSAGFQWDVYPNPASDVINLQYTLQEAASATLVIYNNLGEKITDVTLLQDNAAQQRLSFSTAALHITRGIYFLEVCVNEKKYMKKVAVLD